MKKSVLVEGVKGLLFIGLMVTALIIVTPLLHIHAERGPRSVLGICNQPGGG